jgi:probable F420-dependent oxidoreductase
VKVGIRFGNADWRTDAAGGAEFARTAEDCGFESVWAVDRPTVPWRPGSAYPYDDAGALPDWFHEIDIAEPFGWLTWVAAHTDRIGLGIGVLVLPLRSPVLVAKQAATLDRLAGGRLMLGVGSGWLRDEFDAVGADFHRRHRTFGESVGALRTLWSEPHATFRGDTVAFADLDVRPRPLRSIPLHVGGSSDGAARRAGRYGDGFCPPDGSPEEVGRLVRIARAAAADAGRDPDALDVTVGVADTDLLPRYRRAGVDRVLFAPPGRNRESGLSGLRRLAAILQADRVRLS